MAKRLNNISRRLKTAGPTATITYLLSRQLRPHFWLARIFMLAINLDEVDTSLADHPPMELEDRQVTVAEMAKLKHSFPSGKVKALANREKRGALLRILVAPDDSVLGLVSWTLGDYYDENLGHWFRLAEDEIYTQEAAIHPAHRGKGLGKFLSAIHLRRLLELELVLKRHYSMTEAVNAPSLRMQDRGSLIIVRHYLFFQFLDKIRWMWCYRDIEKGQRGPGRFRHCLRATPPGDSN